MRIINRILSALFFFGTAVTACAQPQVSTADNAATVQTKALYRNLLKLPAKGFLFGHQDDLAYGVEWRYKAGRSDVKETAGDYPGIYGWELGGLEWGSANNIDGVPFGKMKQYIKQGYEKGAVITLSWHATSPFGAIKGAWDTTHGSVTSVLPAGSNHEKYKEWLDNVAAFIGSLKGGKGEAIPVLFRPFHELTGNWFWWCKNACTPQEYITLWRFTVNYLNHVKGLHNIIWVYNTAGNFNADAEFLERYPGDDVVDMLSLDAYQYSDPQKDTYFETNLNKQLSMVGKLATEKNKPFALAETGFEAIPYADWWTKTLMNAIGENKIAYVLVWRNHGLQKESGKMHYYAPYTGQVSVPDFKKFFGLGRTLFEQDAFNEKLYQQ